MFATLQDGTKIYYDIQSPGLRHVESGLEELTPLVLLHGGPGFDHVPFRSFFPRFAERFQIVYYDHRGMGRSSKSNPSEWNLQQWADDLGELLDHLGLDEPLLLGQSFGGFVAQVYASQNPERLRGLVLSSTAARHVPAESADAFERLGGQAARKAAEDFFSQPEEKYWQVYLETCMPFYNQTVQDPAKNAGQILRPEVLFHSWQPGGGDKDMNLLDDLTHANVPAWVLTGQEDPITPPARSREIADCLPHLYNLDIVPGAGHNKDILVYTDKVNQNGTSEKPTD